MLVSVEQYCVESQLDEIKALYEQYVSVEQYCVESFVFLFNHLCCLLVSVEQYCVESDYVWKIALPESKGFRRTILCGKEKIQEWAKEHPPRVSVEQYCVESSLLSLGAT